MAGFDGSLGWGLDAGRAAGDSFRIVQLTPAGSGCSIQFGAGVTSAGFWSGLVARIVKSCPDPSRSAGQGTASVFQGRDAPAPSVMLRSLPARR